jgi:hypothetical protein
MTPSVPIDMSSAPSAASLDSSAVPSALSISGAAPDLSNTIPSLTESGVSLPGDTTWYPTNLTISFNDSTGTTSVNQRISGQILNCAFPLSEALTDVRAHHRTIDVEVGSDKPFAQAFQNVTGLDPRNVGCKVEVFGPRTPEDLAPYIKDGDGISVQAYIPPPSSTSAPTYPPGYPSHLESGGPHNAKQPQYAILASVAVLSMTFFTTISTSL